jgi:putative protease
MRIPELLAPVGSMDHLKVAINAGASAVYLSGKNYGARKYAGNFTLDEIEEAINIAHLHNVRVYVTVNTLIRENELESVINYVSKLHSMGADAVLVQDLGLVELIREHVPDLKIHASTQMTCENQLKLDYLESKGIRRVVLPREMRKEEIENLKTDMELEIFVHGALCYSYSGQCLMSSFKGGRSGNRGTCAQPCRQKYRIAGIRKEDYYLSPCDLNLFDHLKEIAELNIRCIKIEGRMRSKEYLAVVVSNYRKALNRLKSGKTTSSEELNLAFNRGFSEGQFLSSSKRSIRPGHVGLRIGRVIESGRNQIAIKLNDSIKTIPEKGDGLLIVKNDNDYGFEISQDPLITTMNHFRKDKNKPVKDFTRKDKVLIIKKVKQNRNADFNLKGSDAYLTKRNRLTKKVKEIENKGSSYVKSKLILTFSLKNNLPVLKARLTLLNHKKITAEVIGDTPFEEPLRKAVSTDTVQKQLSKLDKYPFEITQININYDGTQFIAISKLNELRRNLFEKLESEIADSYRHDVKSIKLDKAENALKHANINISFYTNNLNHLKHLDSVRRVYLEIPPQEDCLILEDNHYNINYMVSFIKKAVEISDGKDYELVWKWPDITHDKLIKALNRAKGILNKMNMPLPIMSASFNAEYGPYSMNVTNSSTLSSLEGYRMVTVSPELRRSDYEDIIRYAENPDKIEMLVQGSVELMKTRYRILYGKESESDYKNCLIDAKNNAHPIHRSISGEELIIFNDSELSLIDEISHLKNLGYSNFSIDGRYKGDDYYKMIDVYREALNGNINRKELERYSFKNTAGNY